MSGPKHIDSIKRHEMRHQVPGAARTLTPSEVKKLAIGALSSLKQELLLSRPALSSLSKENLALFDGLLNNTSSLLSTLWQENKLSAGTKKAVTNLLAQLDLAAKDTVGLQLNGKIKNLIANVMDALSQLQPDGKKPANPGTPMAGLPYLGPETVNPVMQATIIPAGLSFAAFSLKLSIPDVSLFTPLTQASNRSVEEQRAVYHRFTSDLIHVEESNPASEVLSVALAERVNDTFLREATRRGKETEKQLQAAFEKALQEVQAEVKRINTQISQTRQESVKNTASHTAENVSVEFLSTEIGFATVAAKTGETAQISISGKLTTSEIALAATTLLSHLPVQEALATIAGESVRIAREIPRHEVELQNLTTQIVGQFTGQPIANLPTVANQANLPANLNMVTGKTSPVLSPEARVVATIVSALVAAIAVPKEEIVRTAFASVAQTAAQENRPTLTIDQTTYTGPQVSAPSQAPERASTVFTSATSVGQAGTSEPKAAANTQTISEPAKIVELIRVVAQKLPAASLPALMAEAAKLTSNPALRQEVEAIIITAATTKEGQKYVMEAARHGETAPLLSPASEVGSRVVVETVKALIDPKVRLQAMRETKSVAASQTSKPATVTEQVAQLAILVANTNKIAPTALTAAQALPLLEFVAQAQQARQTIKETQAQIAKDIKDGKLPAPAKPAPLSSFNPIQGKPRTAANPKQIETIVDSLGTLAKSAQKMEAAGLKVPNAIMQSISAGLSGLNLVPAQMTNQAKAPESKPAPRGQLDSFVKVLEAEIERLQTVATTTSNKAPTRFVAWQVQAQIEAIIISIQAAAANESKIKKILKELEEKGLLEKVLKALKDGDADSIEAARDAIYQMRLIVNTREIEFNRAA
ncbi:hypothetical protein A3K48_01015 [candidate division WOR-1 bacterium RIFOXYA12_FULL_52_29]|uniref:Uncharacterized protein n=1 Tax=candidate division WOR-1 bacterium RIFOXYC12_FULL_54_18 TaxID=1802584 RepID=A0A1F4T4W9_UNCSA|nr:MAG: hypothetical protein A3K44_01015 [candidate division WOR-1 bacterium RIFOXYA2_FULL_51_19]OGC17173.1 MAG: hypothetical protein A3K48_01015 [candidate division WOR-1 bacterium RIFOXYA12_FULL_52_29]OGC26033.1 MAG: hypothetical protein A3K32_01010 [candidate division WOR-1 bacterium RIFOXYB2_FULL_45_9]OGC27590.1 MAG: hypothetical protein A3K49_01015 [candidate division WOR-1 bacterium RIFOXYC12_FULL_54_18]OGC29196.1 MAG: hypothetical protein A2346_00690 [candidate division WOR-1 bacterium R